MWCCRCSVAVVISKLLAPVVQTLDRAIHWINHYPLDNSIGFASVYPLDSDLSAGQRYPSFEQLGPEFHLSAKLTVAEKGHAIFFVASLQLAIATFRFL